MKLAVRKADGTKWAVKIIDKQSLSREDEDALQTEVTILQVSEKNASIVCLSIHLLQFVETNVRCGRCHVLKTRAVLHDGCGDYVVSTPLL